MVLGFVRICGTSENGAGAFMKSNRRARMLRIATPMLTTCTASAQEKHDPAEPPAGAPKPKLLSRPEGAIARSAIDEKAMASLIHDLVTCGTRLTLSSWTDPKRGVGCGRDFSIARLNEI